MSTTFDGRSRRLELLCYYLAILPLGVASAFLLSPTPRWQHWLAIGLLNIPMPALLVRRFHDQGRAFWWPLCCGAIFLGIGAIGTREIDRFFSSFPPPLDLLASSMLLAVMVAALVLIYLPGTHGPNRFGPDPRGMRSASSR